MEAIKSGQDAAAWTYAVTSMATTKKDDSNERSVMKTIRIPADVDDLLNEELNELKKSTMTNITYHQLLVSILRKHCESRKRKGKK